MFHRLPINLKFLYYTFGLLSLNVFIQADASFPYYGTKIGSLKRLHHGVSGDVFAVDSRTLFIKKFNYDGEAPAAYFYVGNSNKPSNEGAFRLRDEKGGTASLTRRYRNKDITLTLPEGKTLKDIKWFSVWCDEFAVNFGDVTIPSNLELPRPQKIASLGGVHGVKSDNIVIVDAQTLLVPNFSYDGEAPDAKFWVGQGERPSANGLRIPDENGKENPLRRYDHKTIVLTLPDDLTVFDIGHFGVWCEAFTVDFGHVQIPKSLNVPPSLKMLGISPQSKLNCEVLYDDLAFEVRWAVAGESVVVQLVAKLEDNEYMSFGISPDKDQSMMIGADVVVAWVDQESGKGYAQDYYLEDKSQCSGKRGSCPDINLLDNSNSIRLLNAAMVNGYSIVTYQRSLNATDKLDLPISITKPEAIVWAIGPLNARKETSFHSQYPKNSHFIDFGRQPMWNCPMPEGSTKPSSSTSSGQQTSSTETETDSFQDDNENSNDTDTDQTGYEAGTRKTSQRVDEEYYENRAQALKGGNNRRPPATPKPVSTAIAAWEIPAIQCYEPEDGVFYAQMGPTGGKHGYSAITGHVGWGISWYINGLLIPEIHVVRGKTYTFVVEGGSNSDIPAKYHPFYITDDPIGGYEHKREEEKKNVRIFAGVHRSRSNQITPIGVGRLCNWTPDVDGPPADEYQSFGAYQRTLTLKCDPGEPGVITWKPDRNTPDTVYYQCFTHRYLGWKIHVHNSCEDERFAASEKHLTRLSSTSDVNHDDNDEENLDHFSRNGSIDSDSDVDAVGEASIRHETKNPQKSISLSDYLRPPYNAPLFHLVKLPARRPFPGPIKKVPASKPILPQQLPPRYHGPPAAALTQSSSNTVSHYRKPPIPSVIRPFVRDKPPYPPLAASVLMLGQPTELTIGNILRKPDSLMLKKTKPNIPVPYSDLNPHESIPKSTYVSNINTLEKFKKPNFSQHKSHSLYTTAPSPISLPLPSSSSVSAIGIGAGLSILSTQPLSNNQTKLVSLGGFKKPFDVHENKNEPTMAEIATMKPAVNEGFKPDTVVVESGFRPILRHDGPLPPPEVIEQIASRREDPGSEIDEAMETDTLFLTAQKGTQTNHFEPMFIPSPPDSTNRSNILMHKIIAPPLSIESLPLTQTKSTEISSAVNKTSISLVTILSDSLQDNKPPNVNDDEENSNETIRRNSVIDGSFERISDNLNLNEPIDYDKELLLEMMGSDKDNAISSFDEQEVKALHLTPVSKIKSPNLSVFHSNNNISDDYDNMATGNDHQEKEVNFSNATFTPHLYLSGKLKNYNRQNPIQSNHTNLQRSEHSVAVVFYDEDKNSGDFSWELDDDLAFKEKVLGTPISELPKAFKLVSTNNPTLLKKTSNETVIPTTDASSSILEQTTAKQLPESNTSTTEQKKLATSSKASTTTEYPSPLPLPAISLQAR